MKPVEKGLKNPWKSDRFSTGSQTPAKVGRFLNRKLTSMWKASCGKLWKTRQARFPTDVLAPPACGKPIVTRIGVQADRRPKGTAERVAKRWVGRAMKKSSNCGCESRWLAKARTFCS